jgi:hypothetical protein
MTLQSDVRYVLVRFAIQDVIPRYGLGQDLHQGDNEDQNMLAQWADVFAPDAVIDASDVEPSAGTAWPSTSSSCAARTARGDQRLGRLFGLWQHRDCHLALLPHPSDPRRQRQRHSHRPVARPAGKGAAEGWRIVHRRLENGFFNTFPRIANPRDMAGNHLADR